MKTWAVPGSYADVLMKKGFKKGFKKGYIEGIKIAEELQNAAFVCRTLKVLPSKTDIDIAAAVVVPVEYVTKMRTLLHKNTLETAVPEIKKTFFRKIKLTEQEQNKLTANVEYYYRINA